MQKNLGNTQCLKMMKYFQLEFSRKNQYWNLHRFLARKFKYQLVANKKWVVIFKNWDYFECFWNAVRVQGCCIDYSEFLMQWKSSVCGLVKRAGMEPCLPVPEDAILFDVTNAENHSLASTHQCNFLQTWWEFRRIRTLSRITQHYQ